MNHEEIHIGSSVIRIVRGDITHERVDAIVNATNASLRPGGGVCGAIHTAGGKTLTEDCRRVMADREQLVPGEAVATVAGDLKAQYVIHALGPVWHGGDHGEAEALASAYRTSVEIADRLGLQSIAFPSISTGIYGYPMMAAAHVALRALRTALERTHSVREVRVVLYDADAYEAWLGAAR
ncbi:MAG: macro domain-containing protein [Actinobacteria bacterium]|nr:MAG: macro domain-containing protein [Actinomycetota bacterium]